MGASGLALERLIKPFGYSLVTFDAHGVNLYFVRDDVLGAPFTHSFADLTPNYYLPVETWRPIHADCQRHIWVEVSDAPAVIVKKDRWRRALKPVALAHESVHDGRARLFKPVPVDLPATSE